MSNQNGQGPLIPPPPKNDNPAIIIELKDGQLLMRSAFTADTTMFYLWKMLFMTTMQATKPVSPILKPTTGGIGFG